MAVTVYSTVWSKNSRGKTRRRNVNDRRRNNTAPVCIDPRSVSVRRWTPLLRWPWTPPATGSTSQSSRSPVAPRSPSGWSCSSDGAGRPVPLPPSCVWTASRNSGARARAGRMATCGADAADRSCPASPSSTSVASSSAVSWTCMPVGSTGTRSWSTAASGGCVVLGTDYSIRIRIQYQYTCDFLHGL